MYENTPVADGFGPMIGLDQPDTLTAEGLWLPQGYGDVGHRWYSANDLGNFYYLGPGKTNPALHTGVDLNLRQPGNWDADRLRPVYAPVNAVVTYAANRPSTWGNLMVVRTQYDGELFWIRFGHFKEMLKKVGEVVTRGDLLGHVGDGGGRFPYHLHGDLIRLNPALGFSVVEPPESHPQYGAWHWPGLREIDLFENYLEPLAFTRLRRPGMTPPLPTPVATGIAAIATTTLNVRSAPLVTARHLRTYQAGKRFSLVPDSLTNGYVQLAEEISGQPAWVFAAGVLPLEGPEGSAARMVKSVANIRARPTTALGTIRGKANPGAIMLVQPDVMVADGHRWGQIKSGRWPEHYIAMDLLR